MNQAFDKKISALIKRLQEEEFLIEDERQVTLKTFAQEISHCLKESKKANVLVICTHNSRRSQLGELWLRVASEYFNIQNFKSYSGGTEATAFNIRMVQAIQRAGFRIDQKSAGENPIYNISWLQGKLNPTDMFSKVFDDPFNPSSNFMVMTVCDHAEQNCPIVLGADSRFYIGYEDPKAYDDTLQEEIHYESKVREIGREMLYMMKQVRP